MRPAVVYALQTWVPLSGDVDLSIIAAGTPGFVGADLENLVNEAALLAARQDKEAVAMEDFELAKDKVLMGSERRSMVMSDPSEAEAWRPGPHDPDPQETAEWRDAVSALVTVRVFAPLASTRLSVPAPRLTVAPEMAAPSVTSSAPEPASSGSPSPTLSSRAVWSGSSSTTEAA